MCDALIKISKNNLKKDDLVNDRLGSPYYFLEVSESTIKVKTCRVPNCSCVENKKTNILKHHYVLYHDEMSYLSNSFKEVKNPKA